MPHRHRGLNRRERLALLRAAITGIAQGTARALLDMLFTLH
jgi:hypothetical protein